MYFRSYPEVLAFNQEVSASGPYCTNFTPYGITFRALVNQTPYLTVTRIAPMHKALETDWAAGLVETTSWTIGYSALAKFTHYGAIWYFVRTQPVVGSFCAIHGGGINRRIHVLINEHGTGHIDYID
jgi:hypothetical protein